MVSWHPKRSKFVLLLSSLHHNSNIVESGKPEIVEFYNKTKGGVDDLDQKVCHYTTWRKTHRWSLAVFYNMLDISAYNVYVLFNIHPPAQGVDNSSRVRFKFLCSLGDQLLKPNMLLRACYPNGLNLPTKNALKVFGVAVVSQKIQRRDEPPPKWWCQLCPCNRDRKVKQQCSECHNHVCKEHSKKLRYCYDCVEEEIEDWTFCWATVSSKIWHILVVFGLLKHSHSYIYLVKALKFIGLLILFICSWFSVTKISSSSFLLNFCAFLALLFSLFE